MATVPFQFKQLYREIFDFAGSVNKMSLEEIHAFNAYINKPFSEVVFAKFGPMCPLNSDNFMAFVAAGQAETGEKFDDLAWGYVEGYAKHNLFNGEENAPLKTIRSAIDFVVKSSIKEPDLSEGWKQACPPESERITPKELMAFLKLAVKKVPLLELLRGCQYRGKGGKKAPPKISPPAAPTANAPAESSPAAEPSSPASPAKPPAPAKEESVEVAPASPAAPPPAPPPPPPPPTPPVAAVQKSAPSVAPPPPQKAPPPPPPPKKAVAAPAPEKQEPPPAPAPPPVAPPAADPSPKQSDTSATAADAERLTPGTGASSPGALVSPPAQAPSPAVSQPPVQAPQPTPANRAGKSERVVLIDELEREGSFAGPSSGSGPNAVGRMGSFATPTGQLAAHLSRGASSSPVGSANGSTVEVGVSANIGEAKLPTEVIELAAELDRRRDLLRNELDKELELLSSNNDAIKTLKERIEILQSRNAVPVGSEALLLPLMDGSAATETAKLQARMEKWVAATRQKQMLIRNEVLRLREAEKYHHVYGSISGAPLVAASQAPAGWPQSFAPGTSSRFHQVEGSMPPGHSDASFQDELRLHSALRVSKFTDDLSEKAKALREKEKALARLRKLQEEEEMITAELLNAEKAAKQLREQDEQNQVAVLEEISRARRGGGASGGGSHSYGYVAPGAHPRQEIPRSSGVSDSGSHHSREGVSRLQPTSASPRPRVASTIPNQTVSLSPQPQGAHPTYGTHASDQSGRLSSEHLNRLLSNKTR